MALEKAERETVALLRDKLEQQRLRIQKLGVNVEEGDMPASRPPVFVPPSARKE